MRISISIPLLSVALVIAGCDSAPPAEEEVPGTEAVAGEGLAQLEGTWTSDNVAVSGHGNFSGTSTVTYNADGTYRSEASFTHPETGCEAMLVHTGTYTGDDTTMQVQPTGGEVEVTSCSDEADNIERRAHEEADLTASTVAWTVQDGVLTLEAEDGLDRTYRQQ